MQRAAKEGGKFDQIRHVPEAVACIQSTTGISTATYLEQYIVGHPSKLPLKTFAFFVILPPMEGNRTKKYYFP